MLAVNRISVASLHVPKTSGFVPSSRRLRNFSTSMAIHSKEKTSNSSKAHVNPGELPKFSMKSLLGEAPPMVKAVVWTMIGIIGTAETYTYSLWAYHRWFKPAQEATKDFEP